MTATDGTHILLPVDGSETSLRAAEYCVWFARATGGRVVARKLREALATASAADALEILAGTPNEFLMAEGEPAETIGRIAEEKGCTHVVMGTRGLGKVSGVLMGSVAMKTFHLVSVPLTFIR